MVAIRIAAAAEAFPVSYRPRYPRYHAETSVPPFLSLSLRSRLLSVQKYTPMPMTNAFPYPVASILDANGPFHGGTTRRYLMVFTPPMHTGENTLWLAASLPFPLSLCFRGKRANGREFTIAEPDWTVSVLG